jgi:hypothetical protein
MLSPRTPAEEAVNSVLKYRDSFGLITQANGDGGDTAQREGMINVLCYLLYKSELITSEYWHYIKIRSGDVFRKLGPSFEGYRRHPDKRKWYSNPNNFSRDQSVALCLAFGFVDLLRLEFFWSEHKDRWFFYPNTRRNFGVKGWKIPDITGPSHFGQFIRGFMAKRWRWLLYFTDSFDFFHSLSRYIKGHLDKDHADDLNFILSLLQAKVRYPTFWNKWALWVYDKTPRPALAHVAKKDITKHTLRQPKAIPMPVAAFRRYFHPNWGGAPFDGILEHIVEDYL